MAGKPFYNEDKVWSLWKKKDVTRPRNNSEDNKPQKWMNKNKLEAAILKFPSLFNFNFLLLYSAIHPQEKSTEIVVYGRALNKSGKFFFSRG